MPDSLFPFALKGKALRPPAEVICRRCAGTGNGEDIADLGEARFHGAELPVRQCKSCGGSGVGIAETEIGALCLALLLAAAAFWVCPAGERWILMLSLISIAILGSAWSHDRVPARRAETDAPGPSTEGVLALHTALESERQVENHEEARPELSQPKAKR